MVRGWVVLGLLAANVARAEVTVNLSPEVPVAERVTCPATANEMAMALGPGGDLLVAWLDTRFFRPAPAIVVARVDASGVNQDPSGIFVGEGTLAKNPTVAFDGIDYLVAWPDEGVKLARVSIDGTVLDTTPIAIAGAPDQVSAAGSGGQFLVVWRDNFSKVLASRVAADGSVLDPTPLVLGTAALVRGGPTAIFDGTNYVIVWSGAGIQAARVSTSGAVIAPGQVDLVPQITGFQPDPAITFSGTEYMVAWDAGSLYHMRVSTSMAPIGSPVSSYGAGEPPAIAFDGTHYTIALEHDQGGLGLVHVTAGNVYEDLQAIPLPGKANFGEARLLFDGTRWIVGAMSDYMAIGIRVAADNTVLDTPPRTWSLAQNDQHTASIASDGETTYLVAWNDSRDDSEDTSIYVARLAEGGGLDGSGIRLDGPLEFGGGVGSVAIGQAHTPGSTALVVWDSEFPSDLRAARVSAAGVVIDASPLILSAGFETDLEIEGGSINVACTTSTCLVTWEGSSFDVRGVRVDLATGMVVDTTPLDFGGGISPRAAATEDSFIVTGGLFKHLPERGAPQQIMLYPSQGIRSWDLAWDGSHFLYVWTRIVGEVVSLHGTLLDHDGALVGDEIELGTIDGSGIVNVVHDGTQWVVTWFPWLFATPDSVYAARVTSDGTLRDPVAVSLPTGVGASAFAGGSDGRFVIVREVATSTTPGRGTVLAATWASITGDPPPGTGEDPDDAGESGGCCRTDRGGSGWCAIVAFVGLVLRRRRPSARGARTAS